MGKMNEQSFNDPHHPKAGWYNHSHAAFCFLFYVIYDYEKAPIRPIHNKLTLVPLMAWGRTAIKPLSELMMTEFSYTYM